MGRPGSLRAVAARQTNKGEFGAGGIATRDCWTTHTTTHTRTRMCAQQYKKNTEGVIEIEEVM